MIPRTERGAVEKLYRIRQYLYVIMAGGRNVSSEQIIAMLDACDIISAAQLRIGE